MAYVNIEKCGIYQDNCQEWSRKTRNNKNGATSRLTLFGPSRRPKDPQEIQRPKAMQHTYMLHKSMRHFLPRCSRTTPWRWWISRRLHKPTWHRPRFSRRRYQIYQSRLLTSLWNLQQHKPITPILKNWDISQPRPLTDIRRPETKPCQILTQVNTETYILEADRGSTLTGTAPPKDTRWRSPKRLQHVASPEMVTTSHLRDYKLREGRRGISSGSTADWLS